MTETEKANLRLDCLKIAAGQVQQVGGDIVELANKNFEFVMGTTLPKSEPKPETSETSTGEAENG